MNITGLKETLAATTDADLVDELVDAYEELKVRYFRRDFRPGVLEGGRFAEAAFRILQSLATGSYTPLGRSLPNVPQLLQTLENSNAQAVSESVRIHIPRALASIYNVRNRRDVGHIGADVDANSMDAEYVVGTCNWVLAEFVRLLHQCSPEEAQGYVRAIVERRAPLVEVFGNSHFVLARDLPDKDEILMLLYHCQSATLSELDDWIPSTSRAVISARLRDLEHKYRYVRRVDGRIHITATGSQYVESRLLPK